MPLWLPSLPRDVSVSAILSSVAAAAAAAAAATAASFLIYKSHLRPHKENLITLHQEQPKRNPRGKILFVSRIGFSTAEAVAKRLCDLLESKGLVLEVVDARTYDPEDLPKENLILLLHSTSHNQPPLPFADNSKGAKDFASWLVDNAESFGIGAVVVKACSFTAFVVGKRDGQNLMAKAANHIRDLDHVQYDSDFEEWWGSVVAAVSGEVANGMCRESEAEDDAGCCDPKCIYMLVENVDDGDRSTPYRRRMLTISEANFMKSGTVDLEDGGPVTVQWPLPNGEATYYRLPFKEFCSVGLSLFFIGYLDENIATERVFDYAEKMWCLKYDGHTWIWSLCRTIFFPDQLRPIIIPYDGKLCFIGDDLWVDIYNLKSEFWEKREVPASVRMDPHSYFLWETLIVLYSSDDVNQWLMSYDLNANIWSPFECNFPPVRDYRAYRKFVRLGCSDFLLIIDFVSIWWIYDLSKKKPAAVVHVNDLDEIGMVSDVLCCHHTSKESLIYVFINTDYMDIKMDIEGPNDYINFVPYVRVKLQTDGNFSAKVESKGNLKVGPHMKYYVFAAEDQDIKGKTTVA